MEMFAMVIPDTKPATEYVDGRLVQQVSPKRRHALLQQRLILAFAAWPQCPGEALPEWRFNFIAAGVTVPKASRQGAQPVARFARLAWSR